MSLTTSQRAPRVLQFLACAASLLLLAGKQSATAATSVTSYGITWFFSEDRPVGQFANGDWWVVGPVTITGISPNDTAPTDGVDIHGTMINPAFNTSGTAGWNALQGFDSRIRDSSYQAGLNVAKRLPVTVAAGSSVLSSKSVLAAVSGDNQQLDEIAILTVVSSAPAAGTFRPPYIGTQKPLTWNKSQLLYSRLKKLAPVASTPTFAATEAQFARPMIAFGPSWTGRYMHPVQHDNPNYGREIAHKLGAGMLLLNLNYTDAQKETLLIRMVQRGIDLYGILNTGGGWWPDGGQNHGRKGFVVLAGAILNDSQILARVNGGFQEDGQHFYVSQADVTRAREAGREPYTSAMIGMPEWGEKHSINAARDGSQWVINYRDINGVANMGAILAARIMGIESLWNHPATFDYIDRFYAIEAANVSTSPNSIQPFVSNMWKAYRGTGSGITPPPVTTFAIGDRISTIRNTNVRATGALSGTLLGVQLAGNLGTIVAGPITADSITWWQVNYDAGADGWSGADNFAKSNIAPPAPTPPAPPGGVIVGED